MMEFTTEKFSGPLGLLLSLIESEELDITEVNLAKIADEYVNYIRQAASINPEELADFLVVAAKLLFIKSKALLPYLYAGEEEEELNDLEKQLRMYKEFITASQKIQAIINQKNFLFLPPLIKNRRAQFNLPVFSPPPKLTALVMRDKFLQIITNLAEQQEKKLPEEILEPKISIEEKILLIKNLLIDRLKVNFSKLLAAAPTKTEIIVSFLAILELAKQKELIFEQEDLFSDIHLSKLQS